MTKPLPLDVTKLRDFVIESNTVEGIVRDEKTLKEEVEAHERLLRCKKVEVRDVVRLVNTVQPNAQFRDHQDIPGVCVIARVQRRHHTETVVMSEPPESGPLIRARLQDVLDKVERMENVYTNHLLYEELHPFTDGNGRSGRAVWLWQMLRTDIPWGYRFELPFLQKWYYDSFSMLAQEPRI